MLTFTVQINGFGTADADVNVHQILEELLHWYIVVKQKGYKSFIVSKLLSTLSLFFSKFPRIWPHPIATIVAIHFAGSYNAGLTGNENPAEINDVVSKLSGQDVKSLLEFCRTLVEDLSSNNLTRTAEAEINQLLVLGLPWLVSILQSALSFVNQQESDNYDVSMCQTSLSALEAWVLHFAHEKISLSPLQPFCQVIVELLARVEDEQAYTAVCDFVITIYSGCKQYWVKSFKLALQDYLVETGGPLTVLYPALEKENEKINSFIKLLIANCGDTMTEFLKDPSTHEEFRILLDYLTVFSGNTLISLADDSLANEMLEFWNSFVEEIVSGGFLSSFERLQLRDYITNIITIYWGKIKMPATPTSSSWSKEDWEKLRSFRLDFGDFLELIYPLIGLPIFEDLTRQIIENLSSPHKDWETVECSLYCISKLSDLIEDDGREYEYFKHLLSSSLFGDLISCDIVRIRLTAINLIGSYSAFFERKDGEPYIADALDYLFKSLTFPSLSLGASKSIQKLCYLARKHLTHMIPSFLTIYKDMNLYPQLDNTAHERIIYAIGYIIQSLEDLHTQHQYIDQITEILIKEIASAIHATSDLTDASSVRVRSRLKCLERLGKSLQSPDEQDDVPDEVIIRVQKFWNETAVETRNCILLIVKELALERSPFDQDFEICEICCDILKAGFSEKLDTLFVFPADTIVQFISQKYRHGPLSCLSLLVDLSRCLLTRDRARKDGASGMAPAYIDTLLNLFFSTPVVEEYEPDIQVGNLKFITQLLSTEYYLQYFLYYQNTPAIIEFCVQLVDSSDRFVLRTASQFWVKFLTLDTELKPRLLEIIQAVGPALVKILVRKISGDCARSELDFYSDIIKKLVFKYTLVSKPWFEFSIMRDPDTSLAGRDKKLRTQFLSKIFALRGARETNQAIKEFWLACRGMTGYAI